MDEDDELPAYDFGAVTPDQILDQAVRIARTRGVRCHGWMMQRELGHDLNGGEDGPFFAWLYASTDTEETAIFSQAFGYVSPIEAAQQCLRQAGSLERAEEPPGEESL